MACRNAALRLAAALAVVLGEIGLWWLTGVWRISRGLLQPTFELYVVIFFPALVLATFGYCHLRASSGMLAEAIAGMATGFAISVVAVNVATLLLPDGLQRLDNSRQLGGLSALVLSQLGLSPLLGGWLFGAVAFSAASKIATLLTRR